MRRRIYMNPEGPMEDQTATPYLYATKYEPRIAICRSPALYDDELWERYEAALKVVSGIYGEIMRKLIPEPWDETEIRLHEESIRIMANEEYDSDDLDRIGDQAVAHAKTRTEPQK